MDSLGDLSGTPAATGSYVFTVTATDGYGSTGTRVYTLNVNIAPLDINPPSLLDAVAGPSYTEVLTGSGGTAPYNFALTSGNALPPGLSLSTDGQITGVPTVAGSSIFSITVTDFAGQIATRTYDFYVDLSPLEVTATLPVGGYAVAFDSSFTTTGGTPPYKYSIPNGFWTPGKLPPGLSISTAGKVSGVPTTWGTFTFYVTAVDDFGDEGTYPFTLVVAPPAIVMTPDDLFAATSGLFYGAKITATGGLGTYTYSLAGGTLPVGLTLAADGTISGIANQVPGLFTFTVKATDSNGATGTKVMTLMLATPTILVTSYALPTATIGVTYLQSLSVTGGTAPYTYSLVDGVVPTGLTLSAGGTLSGSPTTAGTSTFTVLIVDANGIKATQSFRIVVEKSSSTVVKKPPKKVVAAPVKQKVATPVKEEGSGEAQGEGESESDAEALGPELASTSPGREAAEGEGFEPSTRLDDA